MTTEQKEEKNKEQVETEHIPSNINHFHYHPAHVVAET
jgi:hypothetical protein